MAWMKLILEGHVCEMPQIGTEWAKKIQAGSQWQCEACKKIHTLTRVDRSTPFNTMLEWASES